MNSQALVLYASVVLIWGSTWAAIPYQLGVVAEEVSVAYRFAIGAIILYLYAIVAGKKIKLPLRYFPMVVAQATSGLDPIVHDDFLEALLHSICGRGTTVLYSSHNLEDIRRLADSVCILRAGKILVHSGVDELLASVKRIRVVLIDGQLPHWVPEGTLAQRIQNREWLLTVGHFNTAVAERLKAENPVESLSVFDLSLGELFKDYILGEAAR